MECYPYMENLKELEQRGINPLNQEICSVLSKVSPPLHLKSGPKVCASTQTRSSAVIVIANPTVVKEYLTLECKLGRVVCPLDLAFFPHIQRNRFGVILKPHQQGKWQLIVDLLHPEGSSVNDGIAPSLWYVSMDDAVKVILALGKGTELAKFDIQSAYRIVPIHPTDRYLLGMMWNGQLYVDTALPFGLRSAPKIFKLFDSCKSSYFQVYLSICLYSSVNVGE